MSRRTTQMKHGVPVEAEPDTYRGEPATLVKVGNSVPFAMACFKLMSQRYRQDHMWKLRSGKGWLVPNDIMEQARAIVEGAEQP